MGNSVSQEEADSVGYRVLGVQPLSPASKYIIQCFFSALSTYFFISLSLFFTSNSPFLYFFPVLLFLSICQQLLASICFWHSYVNNTCITIIQDWTSIIFRFHNSRKWKPIERGRRLACRVNQSIWRYTPSSYCI
jgi:hypothetical protein